MAKKYKVALQCGHGKSTDGTWDSGCTYAGYTEASLMLPITKSAVKYLRSYGVTVISDSDKNNNKNMIADVRWANKEKCDIYVSIHCDYKKSPSGVMPLYVSSGGKKLATALNNAVKSGMGMKSRGVVRRTDLWELNGTDMVACILETGSIKADLSTLKNKADAYGKCIAKGICAYLGVKIPTTPTKTTTKELYRVRKSWNDPNSQKGAFQNLEGAKQCADVNGLNVYASNGKLVYSGKKKVTPKPTTWVDRANAWAQKIANDNSWHYVKWSSNAKTHECPICHNHPVGAYHGWNCIGFAFAYWRHGGGLKCTCNCHVIDNAFGTKLLKMDKTKALKELKKKIGLNDIALIRNSGKNIPQSQMKAGDLCLCYTKGKYYHIYPYVGNGYMIDCGNWSNKAKQIAKRKATSAQVVIRYIGK